MTKRLDIINILLIALSCAVAVVVPFELFLFVYAILGPLHYLTEISWLHDRKYFSKNSKDVLLLVAVTFIISLGGLYNPTEPDDVQAFNTYINRLIFIGFGSAFLFAFAGNKIIRWIGVAFLVLVSSVSDSALLFFSIFLPTLLHVFVFTFLFMLYGAVRSGSVYGYLSVLLHLSVPFVLYYLLQGVPAQAITEYGRQAYQSFESINAVFINVLRGDDIGSPDIHYKLFYSPPGIAIMRFIAFAYTYHYLNWFSKTEVIKWHQVPKKRLLVVVLAWLASVCLYLINYRVGFQWLFFLSFLHIMLELPLNFVSVQNIIKEVKGRFV